MRVSTVNHR